MDKNIEIKWISDSNYSEGAKVYRNGELILGLTPTYDIGG